MNLWLWFHLHLLSHRPKWTETSENNWAREILRIQRRRKMMLTAGQQEQQPAPHLSCHQPLILWFLQYLLCHPSNCWLVWNLLLLINKSSFVISCNHINSMMVPLSVNCHLFIHLSTHPMNVYWELQMLKLPQISWISFRDIFMHTWWSLLFSDYNFLFILEVLKNENYKGTSDIPSRDTHCYFPLSVFFT